MRSAAPQLANTQASCAKQAAQAKPKGLLRLLCASDAENVDYKCIYKNRMTFVIRSSSLAVGGGFEPPVRLPVRQFSKLVVSATHPSHQTDSFFLTGLQIYKEFIVLQLFGADFVIFKVEYVTFPEHITLTKPSHIKLTKSLRDGPLFHIYITVLRYFHASQCRPACFSCDSNP